MFFLILYIILFYVLFDSPALEDLLERSHGGLGFMDLEHLVS